MNPSGRLKNDPFAGLQWTTQLDSVSLDQNVFYPVFNQRMGLNPHMWMWSHNKMNGTILGEKWIVWKKKSPEDKRLKLTWPFSGCNIEQCSEIYLRLHCNRRWCGPAAGRCLRDRFQWDQCHAHHWSPPRTAETQRRRADSLTVIIRC